MAEIKSNMSILHSRYAEVKRFYEESDKGLASIPTEHAHPNIDYKERFSLFHNGLIANFHELTKELQE